MILSSFQKSVHFFFSRIKTQITAFGAIFEWFFVCSKQLAFENKCADDV